MWSAAIAHVSARTAPLDAEYEARLGSPEVATIYLVTIVALLVSPARPAPTT